MSQSLATSDFALTEEQRSKRLEIKRFVDREIAPLEYNEWEWRDEPADRVPWPIVEKAAEIGLKNLTAPTEFGGEDASTLLVCVAVEELAVGDLGIAVIFDQCWKIARMIDAYATDEVRSAFFSEYVDDPTHLLAVASTEPSNGSNNLLPYEQGRFDTTAEKDGDAWVINGVKRYISNGADAKTYVVRAQTDPEVPHHAGGATAFLVPAEAPGVNVTHIHEKIGQRLINNATIEFENLRVPEEHVLGEVGGGMATIREGLQASHVEAGASTLGVARAAYEAAFKYAHDRRQGGKRVIDHQVIAHDFAELATQLQATRALIWTAARAVDRHNGNPALASMAKLLAADAAFDVCTRSLEKFGGAGIMLEYPAQKYLRDALSFLHSDGTQTIHKEKISRELRTAEHPE